jgi:Xaa-Pro aminopeptidase
MNQTNETFPQNNEQPKTPAEIEQLLETSKAQLLEATKTQLADMQNRAGEFYDVELCRVFEEAIKDFDSDFEAIRLYLNSIGKNYDQAEENLDKKILFDRTYIRPIKKEIQEIENSLRAIKNKEYRLQQEQLEKEREQKEAENFNREKGELEERLFGALDAIHSKIPQEAKDLAMTTESALKVYLPDLVDRANLLEGYLNQIQEVKNQYELDRLKKDLSFSITDL